MKIAVIGGGISGNVVAYKLHKDHEITLFEANDYLGGHTHTHDIELDGKHFAVDSGFIVFNNRTYPNFVGLLDELNVESKPSSMSFSVRCSGTGLEYNGSNLGTLFCQKKNLVNLGFYRMLKDILKFNRNAPTILGSTESELALAEYLRTGGYSDSFVKFYLLPMGASIWSTDPERVLDFPAGFFVRFLLNHGLLSIDDRPQWRVIKGGSRNYLDAMSRGYRNRIRLSSPVSAVRRLSDGVQIKPVGAEPEHFDAVFLACHSNQALRLLSDPSPFEQSILGALPYQRNTAVLHTDSSILPRYRKAWAAWNYHIPSRDRGVASLTYNMNILQGLNAEKQFLVTLNDPGDIDPRKIIRRMDYEHPLFTADGVDAQGQQDRINGINRTFFCGAYWRNGFHEDGVVSALNALRSFRTLHDYEKLYLHRAG